MKNYYLFSNHAIRLISFSLLVLLLNLSCEQNIDDVAPAIINDFTYDDPIIDPDIDKIIKEEFAYQNMIGLNVAIINNGNIIHRKGYGYMDLTNLEPVATENTFYMNSISKSITAVIAQMLKDELGNNFDWNEKISVYLPDYVDPSCNVTNEPEKDNITIKQLLSNTAGVPHYCDFPYKNATQNYEGWSGTLVNDDILNIFCQEPLIMAPGSNQYRYSSFGFNLAGSVINNVGLDNFGKGYYELADEWLRQDWGMDNLVPDTGERVGKPMRYRMRCNGAIKEENNTEDRTWALPGSGWLCNPDDLAKFGNNLINGTVNTATLWDDELGIMPNIRCNEVINGQTPGYAHGFSVYQSMAKYGHGGSHPDSGAKSSMVIHKSKNYVIVGMTNTDWWQWDRIRAQIENYLDPGASNNVPAYNFSKRTRCDSGETCEDYSPKIFNSLWEKGLENLRSIRYEISSEDIERQLVDMKECGFVPVDIDFRDFDHENIDSWNVVFEKSNKETQAEINIPFNEDQFVFLIQSYKKLGLEVIDLEVYEKNGQLMWAIITEEDSKERISILEMTEEELFEYNSKFINQGLLPIDIEVYINSNGQSRYACVWKEKIGDAQIFINEEDPQDGTLPPSVQAQIASANMEIIDQEYHGENKQAFVLNTASIFNTISNSTLTFCDLQQNLEIHTSNEFWIKDLEEK